MSKIEPLVIIPSGAYTTTQLNDNFRKIKDALENTVSRDGSLPNSMEADLDLNGFDIINAGYLSAQDILISGSPVLQTIQNARDEALDAVAAFDASLADFQAAVEAAQTAADNAAASEINAAASANAAASSASSAADSAASALTSASQAANSATNATNSATAAADSASAAATSETNAAVSASAAADFAASAANSASQAEQNLHTFQGTYYGAFASAPTTDPLGNPPDAGDLYWDTTVSELRYFDGVAWTPAYSAPHTHDLADANITGVLPINKGGTGQTSAAAALNALGGAPSSRVIGTGTGLTGGGDLSADRTLEAVTLPQTDWDAGASTTEAVISPAKLAGAVGVLAGALENWEPIEVVDMTGLAFYDFSLPSGYRAFRFLFVDIQPAANTGLLAWISEDGVNFIGDGSTGADYTYRWNSLRGSTTVIGSNVAGASHMAVTAQSIKAGREGGNGVAILTGINSGSHTLLNTTFSVPIGSINWGWSRAASTINTSTAQTVAIRISTSSSTITSGWIYMEGLK